MKKKIVLSICIVFVFALLLVYSQAKLSATNKEVETVRRQLQKQLKDNESLEMKLNELASLEKVKQVANKEGLSYQKQNIKIIRQ